MIKNLQNGENFHKRELKKLAEQLEKHIDES
jgi:hypothetical protein